MFYNIFLAFRIKFAASSSSVFEEVAINRNKSKNNIRSQHKHLLSPSSWMTKKIFIFSMEHNKSFDAKRKEWFHLMNMNIASAVWEKSLENQHKSVITTKKSCERIGKKSAEKLTTIFGVEINQLTNGCSSEIAPFYLNQWCLFHINRERQKKKKEEERNCTSLSVQSNPEREGKKSQSRKSFSKLI